MTLSAAAVEIIAHRGASYDAPENTLASAQLAWSQGADGIECDIQLTADGKIIVCHDDTTKRTTGVAGEIKARSFDQLRTLDAGVWKAPQFAGEKLPSLEELLATVPAGKKIFIEIKGGDETVPALAAIRQRSPLPSAQVAIISFDREAVRTAKFRLPSHPAYWIVGYKRGRRQPHTIDEMIALCQRDKIDGLDLDGHRPLDQASVGKIKTAGLALYTWTIDNPERARELIAAGVDGLTTNRPGWLREQLRGN